MTVDSTTGESRKTDFLEEQSAETIGVRNLKMAVSKDGTVYALTRTMDEYGEIHLCLYKISPGGNHTKTLICKALGQVDSNGNPITGALEASPIGIDINDAGDVYYSVYKMTRKNHKDIYNVHLFMNGTEISVYEDIWWNGEYGLYVNGQDVYAWHRVFVADGYKSIIQKNDSVIYEFSNADVNKVRVDKNGDIYYVVNIPSGYEYKSYVYKNDDLLYSIYGYINDLQLM